MLTLLLPQALIQSAVDGFNVTIMAYGQTGSGKTYTMLGTEAHPGIAPRAFRRLFHLIDKGKARCDVQVSAYMMELYNDKLIDLLKPMGRVEVSSPFCTSFGLHHTHAHLDTYYFTKHGVKSREYRIDKTSNYFINTHSLTERAAGHQEGQEGQRTRARSHGAHCVIRRGVESSLPRRSHQQTHSLHKHERGELEITLAYRHLSHGHIQTDRICHEGEGNNVFLNQLKENTNWHYAL